MQKWAIGIDLGGTKIEAAIVDKNGQKFDSIRILTESELGADEVILRIAEITNNICKKHPDIDPSVIGIGVAGQIEKETGSVIFAPNLNWNNVALRKQLTEKLNKPVVVSNDVKAAMWGEWKYGAGAGCDNLICMFIGTGIGGGIVSNGTVLHGCNNTAGEIGHITIDMHGPLCHCGNYGCFEAMAGGWAIERNAKEAVQKDKIAGKLLLELALGDINAITAETVAIAAQKADVLAGKLVDTLTDALIAGSMSVVNVLGPCRFILGGGVIAGMPQLIARIDEGVRKRALKAATKQLEFLPAKLKNDSGVIGAATIALDFLENIKP